MKTSRFTDSQIIGVLKQVEAGTPVPGLCREHGISSATFYDRRKSLFGTSGAASSAGWTPRWCPSSRSCRTRTGA